MKFKFHEASCVVVGTFNIYIVQPRWLVKEQIIVPEGVEFKIHADLTRPGFKFADLSAGIDWIIRPDLLTIETKKPGQDCGERAAMVLHKLPHTPLFAIGNNLVLECDRPQFDALALNSNLPPEIAVQGYKSAQRTWHSGFRKGSSQFNVQISITEDKAVLSSNVHTELSAKDSAFACQTAKEFMAQLHESVSLLSQLLGVEVEYENGNQ